MTAGEITARKVYRVTLSLRKRDLALNIAEHLSQENDKASPYLDLTDISILRASEDLPRTLFQAEDIFLRQRVEPVQSILNAWIRGAKAQVNGQNIPFSDMVSWCQQTSSRAIRKQLSKEARCLCRFLAPFSHATWRTLLESVQQDLGYASYLDFCGKKRGKAFLIYPEMALDFLESSRAAFFRIISSWLGSMDDPVEPSRPDRFDAIYLLGMRYLDHLFPREMKGTDGVNRFVKFFRELLPDPDAVKLHVFGEKGRQAYCIPLEIPGEIHVITGPVRGWQDMEAFFHEFGHALFFACHDPALPPEDKDYFQSAALSECFAFVFQRLSMSSAFLSDFLGLEKDAALVLEGLQKLKFLTLARRYAAKVFIEHENFRLNRVSRGQDLYASAMKDFTGFHYDPETYLFDLMPDFYSIDYFEAFIGAFILMDFLTESWGNRWYDQAEALSLLKSWWRDGNRFTLREFLAAHLGKGLDGKSLIDSVDVMGEDFFVNVKKMAQMV